MASAALAEQTRLSAALIVMAVARVTMKVLTSNAHAYTTSPMTAVDLRALNSNGWLKDHHMTYGLILLKGCPRAWKAQRHCTAAVIYSCCYCTCTAVCADLPRQRQPLADGIELRDGNTQRICLISLVAHEYAGKCMQDIKLDHIPDITDCQDI